MKLIACAAALVALVGLGIATHATSEPAGTGSGVTTTVLADGPVPEGGDSGWGG
ncbi:hypothetical protein [Actinoplanes sp. RD1]|uniref:hypothetical protein n=1 Tax=Actinoplanes sp. RD1 TaxID=3064538 RepID=UPI00274182D0|nr:hypothetical protein [Actinoplanes sp. RD1]